MLEDLLNQVVFVIFVSGAIVPLYLVKKLGRTSFGIMSALLAAFLVFHGLYHFSGSLDLDFYSDVVLEPLSTVFLLSFAIYMYKKGG